MEIFPNDLVRLILRYRPANFALVSKSWRKEVFEAFKNFKAPKKVAQVKELCTSGVAVPILQLYPNQQLQLLRNFALRWDLLELYRPILELAYEEKIGLKVADLNLSLRWKEMWSKGRKFPRKCFKYLWKEQYFYFEYDHNCGTVATQTIWCFREAPLAMLRVIIRSDPTGYLIYLRQYCSMLLIGISNYNRSRLEELLKIFKYYLGREELLKIFKYYLGRELRINSLQEPLSSTGDEKRVNLLRRILGV